MKIHTKSTVLLIVATAAVFIAAQLFATWHYTYSGNFTSKGYDSLNPQLNLGTFGYALLALLFYFYVVLGKKIRAVYQSRIGCVFFYATYAILVGVIATAIFNSSEPFVLSGLVLPGWLVIAAFCMAVVLIGMLLTSYAIAKYRSRAKSELRK